MNPWPALAQRTTRRDRRAERQRAKSQKRALANRDKSAIKRPMHEETI